MMSRSGAGGGRARWCCNSAGQAVVAAVTETAGQADRILNVLSVLNGPAGRPALRICSGALGRMRLPFRTMYASGAPEGLRGSLLQVVGPGRARGGAPGIRTAGMLRREEVGPTRARRARPGMIPTARNMGPGPAGRAGARRDGRGDRGNNTPTTPAVPPRAPGTDADRPRGMGRTAAPQTCFFCTYQRMGCWKLSPVVLPWCMRTDRRPTTSEATHMPVLTIGGQFYISTKFHRRRPRQPRDVAADRPRTLHRLLRRAPELQLSISSVGTSPSCPHRDAAFGDLYESSGPRLRVVGDTPPCQYTARLAPRPQGPQGLPFPMARPTSSARLVSALGDLNRDGGVCDPRRSLDGPEQHHPVRLRGRRQRGPQHRRSPIRPQSDSTCAAAAAGRPAPPPSTPCPVRMVDGLGHRPPTATGFDPGTTPAPPSGPIDELTATTS